MLLVDAAAAMQCHEPAFHLRSSPPPRTHTHTHQQIEVIGVDGELKRVAQEALTARPNFAYTLKVPSVQLFVCRQHGCLF